MIATTTRRRSSHSVAVPLLAALAATALTGCDRNESDADKVNSQDTAVIDSYKDAKECVTAGRYDQETCDKLAAQSAHDYYSNVTRYPTQELCETEYTECHKSPDDIPTPATSDTQPASATQSTQTSHGHGSFVYIYHSSPSPSYAPDYRGFAVPRAATGSVDPQAARAILNTKSGGFGTFSGVRGLSLSEPMAVPRTAVAGHSGGSSSFIVTNFASRPSAIISARGGFGSAGGAHFSFGG